MPIVQNFDSASGNGIKRIYHMKQGHLIAFNTTAMYIQSIVGLCVGIFSVRWILEALGAVDFGLFGVVGSIILLITFLNGGLSVGVGRFYAHAIGKGKKLDPEQSHDELNRWFNTALASHLVLGGLVIFFGWPIGEYVVRNFLDIPPDRLVACVTVFRFSMAAAVFSVLSVPFIALYAAHQALVEQALFGVFSSLLVLGLSWTLLTVESDRLIFYGIGMVSISISVGLLQTARAVVKFKVCRIRLNCFFDKGYSGQLFLYVGWKMFGMSCVVFRNQGIPILTNIFFGPVINASYSIANRLSMQATSLSTSLVSAFQPAIVTAEGMGNRREMIAMSMRVCRIGSLLVLPFILPLILEIDTVLKIWLKTPPDYAGVLCQWVIGLLIFDRMTAGAMIAVNAYGKIALYEIIQGSTFLLALPTMWILKNQGIGPESIGIALFISTVVYCAGRLAFAKNLVEFPLVEWIKTVAIPVAIIAGVGILLGGMICNYFNAGWPRLVMVSIFIASISVVSGFFVLLSRSEKEKCFSSILKIAKFNL